jgi:predicted phosphate transport protein (TIGR00153 family)
MLRLFQALMPQEDIFFHLYASHAETLVAGAAALRELLDGGDNVEACAARVAKHEEAADQVAREGLLAVRRTFITPFDRGDVKALFGSLDDAIDQMHKTAKATLLFEVRQFEPEMRTMGDQIVQAAAKTREMVALLPKMRANAARLNALAEEVTSLEEQADHAYDAGLKSIYQQGKAGDPMRYIVGAEILDHLEKVMDRFEDVAHEISGILIEHL